MNNKVSSVLNSIEKIDNLIMEADVSVSDAMSDVFKTIQDGRKRYRRLH